jgi:hypothetical protein
MKHLRNITKYFISTRLILYVIYNKSPLCLLDARTRSILYHPSIYLLNGFLHSLELLNDCCYTMQLNNLWRFQLFVAKVSYCIYRFVGYLYRNEKQFSFVDNLSVPVVLFEAQSPHQLL